MIRDIPYRSIIGSLGILVIGTTMALGGAWLLARGLIHGANNRFLNQAQTAYSTLTYRLEQEHSRLLAARGFYIGSEDVSPEDWKNFASALYTGNAHGRTLLHLAYAPPTETRDIVEHMKALGISADRIQPRPKKPGEFYCPVDRIWPSDLRSKVLGFNPCGGMNYTLFAQAASGAGLIVTREVPLYSPSGVEQGIVLIASSGTPAAAGKRAGWVAETVPSQSFFTQLLPGAGNLKVVLSDVSSDKPHVLYRSSNTMPKPPGSWERLINQARIGHYSIDLKASNRHWRLALTGRIEAGWIPLAVAASGFIISLLLAALFYALARTGRHAQALATSMTRELSVNRELLTSVSNNVRDGIYRGTPEAGIVYVNRTLARMFGYSDESRVQASQLSLRYANPKRRDELRNQLFREHHYEDEEVEYIRNDGTRFTGLNSAWITRDADGKILYYDGVVTDITERKAAARRIRQMTYYDRLTGLPNQALLEERFEGIADIAASEHHRLAVLLIDLDNFKDVNTLHGHEVGDQLLKEASRRLRNALQSGDIAARIGGDEFIVLMREVNTVETVTQAANQLSEALSVPYRVKDLEMHTTPSIGIAIYPQDGNDLASLRQHADAAMYQAKHSGRASIAYFAEHLNEQARRQVQIENALRQAIERDEMSLHYQPRASLDDGRLCGVEALLRWNHPEWGAIEPSEFIPVAERTGLIVSLGAWVLEQALLEWKRWAEHYDAPPRVGVNVSARQLNEDRRFAETISSLLKKHRVPGEALEIEITESMLVDHLRNRAAALAHIKALGVNIALDDFGTGYSSLSYLSRFNIDVIKVDQSFIRGLAIDSKDTSIVRTVSILSRAVGIRIVAEGVETRAQLDALRRMRYQAVQGFLFARPMPADQLHAFMHKLNKNGPPEAFRSS